MGNESFIFTGDRPEVMLESFEGSMYVVHSF